MEKDKNVVRSSGCVKAIGIDGIERTVDSFDDNILSYKCPFCEKSSSHYIQIVEESKSIWLNKEVVTLKSAAEYVCPFCHNVIIRKTIENIKEEEKRYWVLYGKVIPILGDKFPDCKIEVRRNQKQDEDGLWVYVEGVGKDKFIEGYKIIEDIYKDLIEKDILDIYINLKP